MTWRSHLFDVWFFKRRIKQHKCAYDLCSVVTTGKFMLYVHDAHAATVMIHFCCVFAYVANVNILQRPEDIVRRKRPFALWFPYTTIEQLLYQLEELIRMGHMVDHCDKLKKMLHGSLLNHLKMVNSVCF
jgi:hypothetical protein